MSTPNRFKCEFPLGGDGAQRQGGRMSTPNRFKCEFPLGGTARSAKGAA